MREFAAWIVSAGVALFLFWPIEKLVTYTWDKKRGNSLLWGTVLICLGLSCLVVFGVYQIVSTPGGWSNVSLGSVVAGVGKVFGASD